MNGGGRRFEWTARDESDTERLGGLLAETLPDGAVISLCGTLGAGKTRLVQALAEACGVDRRDVVSPTFVLWQTYSGRRVVRHLDAYRVRDDDEFLELGVTETFGRAGVTIVEWGERVEACLPEDAVRITLEVTGDTSRRVTLELPASTEYDELARRLCAAAARD